MCSAGYLQVKLPLNPKANERILTLNDLYFNLAYIQIKEYFQQNLGTNSVIVPFFNFTVWAVSVCGGGAHAARVFKHSIKEWGLKLGEKESEPRS